MQSLALDVDRLLAGQAAECVHDRTKTIYAETAGRHNQFKAQVLDLSVSSERIREGYARDDYTTTLEEILTLLSRVDVTKLADEEVSPNAPTRETP